MSARFDPTVMLDWAARQAAASHALSACDDVSCMAIALARHLLPDDDSCLFIQLIHRGSHSFQMHTLAGASRSGSCDPDEPDFDVEIATLGPALASAVDAGTPAQVDLSSGAAVSPGFRQWLEAQGWQSFAVIPLRSEETIFGLLVWAARGPALDLPDVVLSLIQVLANHVAARMQVAHLTREAERINDITKENRSLTLQSADTLNFVQAQFEATSAMYKATTPAEIFDAVLKFLGTGFGQSHLALVEQDGQADPDHLMIVAEAVGGQMLTHPRSMALSSYPVWQALSALETLYIPDVRSDTFLMDDERGRLLAQEIGGLLVAPLVFDQRLIGLFTFLNRTPISVSPNSLRALRSLADQAAVVFQNRSLVESTTRALERTQLLYEANRDILAAQDTMDVLRVLRTHLAPDASVINHITTQYDSGGRLLAMTLDYMSTPDSEQVVSIPLHELIGADKLLALQRFWETDPRHVVLIGDLMAEGDDFPLVEYSRSNGVRSLIGMPVRLGDRVVEAITLTYSYHQSFDAQRRQIFEALSDQVAIVQQNHRLLHEAQIGASRLQAQVSTLEQINRLAALVSAAPDEQTLIERSAEGIVSLVGVDHCGIVMLANSGDTYATVAAEYPPHGSVGAQIALQANPLWDELRRTGQPVVVRNVAEDERIEALTRKALNNLGVVSLAILPLMNQGVMVGGVGLDVYSPERLLTLEQVEIGATAVTQINLALQNLRLLANTRRRADQTQRIAAFSQAVQATLDLEAILSIVLNESLQLLPMNQMSVSLYDPLRQEMRAVAQYTDGTHRVSLRDGDSIPMVGHVARVWETWEPLYIPDLRAVSEGIDPGVTLRSWMMTPILSRGRILGIASAGSSQPSAYTDTDIALFNQMTSQLAVAIENAEAYRQTQRLAKNEALINDISSQLQRQFDLNSMLTITASELGRALGARSARILLGTTPAPDGGKETE